LGKFFQVLFAVSAKFLETKVAEITTNGLKNVFNECGDAESGKGTSCLKEAYRNVGNVNVFKG